MAERVTITREAKAHFLGLTAREQRMVADGISARLLDQPMSLSRPVKQLRPNPLAGFELRLGDIRVLYKVDEENAEVLVVLVGRKVGNALIVAGEEFHGHQGDPPERPEG
jgi:mRNA-degrading endonuclease RelE of RelBE toxin-antitoxin system